MELNKFSLFTGLSSVQITKFEKAITRKKFLKNDEIIKEGDSGDSLIFLLDGEVKISKPLTLVTNTNDYDDREKELITLNSSFYPFFGDYSLFTENNQRTANIVASSNGEIGVLMAKDFFQICESDYQLGYLVIKNITKNITSHVVKQGDDILKLTTAISLILEN
jgi:CRP-like cAMP-binding protein